MAVGCFATHWAWLRLGVNKWAKIGEAHTEEGAWVLLNGYDGEKWVSRAGEIPWRT